MCVCVCDRRLLSIEKDRQPEMMTILHNEEDYDYIKDEDEEVTGQSLASDQEEEEDEEEIQESGDKTSCKHWSSIDSPDSSSLSLSSGNSAKSPRTQTLRMLKWHMTVFIEWQTITLLTEMSWVNQVCLAMWTKTE